MRNRIYSEVYAVLLELGDDYTSKIPTNFMELIENGRDKGYEVTIDSNKPLNEQGFAKETIATIAMLKLDYWCESDTEKAELLELLETNQQRINEFLQSSANTREMIKRLKDA